MQKNNYRLNENTFLYKEEHYYLFSYYAKNRSLIKLNLPLSCKCNKIIWCADLIYYIAFFSNFQQIIRVTDAIRCTYSLTTQMKNNKWCNKSTLLYIMLKLLVNMYVLRIAVPYWFYFMWKGWEKKVPFKRELYLNDKI